MQCCQQLGIDAIARRRRALLEDTAAEAGAQLRRTQAASTASVDFTVVSGFDMSGPVNSDGFGGAILDAANTDCADFQTIADCDAAVINGEAADMSTYDADFTTVISFMVVADTTAIALNAIDTLQDPAAFAAAMSRFGSTNVTVDSIQCQNCDMIVQTATLPVQFIAIVVAMFAVGACLVGALVYRAQTGGMPTLLAFEDNTGLPEKEKKAPKEDTQEPNPMFNNPMHGSDEEIDEEDVEKVKKKGDDNED